MSKRFDLVVKDWEKASGVQMDTALYGAIADFIDKEGKKERREMGDELYCRLQSILDDCLLAAERKMKEAMEDYLKERET